jgi:predicted XRE-type DNA-binding protein
MNMSRRDNKMTKGERLYQEFKNDPEYVTHELALELTAQIAELMEDLGVSQAEMARRMKVSEARVSALFGLHTSNLTLKTLAKAMIALDAHMTAKVKPRDAAPQAQHVSFPDLALALWPSTTTRATTSGRHAAGTASRAPDAHPESDGAQAA